MPEGVTTRRIIKPGGTVTAPTPPSAAMEARSQSMWLAWRQRFQERERMAAAGQTQERAMWSGLPMRADPALSRQVNERFLQPWVSLRETFDLAASTADLSPALRADYLSYLGLRVDYYQAVSRRCLNPTPATCASLVEQERRIDAFIAQRRAASA